jgi:iron complex transport system substrate-binding protein
MDIGGFLDLNYEAIITLKPDLVILLPEHRKAKDYLAEFGIKTIEVDNKTIADILGAIKIIGDSCYAKTEATNLLVNINKRIESIKKKTAHLQKPSTLVSISRVFGIGTLKDVYVAGVPTYFNEIIEMAGGINAYKNDKIAYPNISTEGLIHLNPEAIIDFVNNLKESNLTKEIVLKDWQSVEYIEAVKNNRVTVLDSDYISIPGPRFVLLLKDIAKAIHPEINWEEL